MSEDGGRRKRRRLLRGLLGPRFYRPRKPPTRIKVLRRQLFVFGISFIVALLVFGPILDSTRWAAVTSVVAVGGWLILMGLNLRYLYRFAFRKDKRELEEEENQSREAN
jgi:uncharacterized membrane protein